MANEKIIRSFFVLLCCLEFISEIISGPTAYTSCKTTYTCVPLRECRSYMVFITSLQKPLNPSVVEFLREKQCGFHEGHPKVCCADATTDNSAIEPKRSNFKTCHVDNECVPLKNCKPFMDIINTMEKPLKPSFVTFLRAQQCGFQEGYPTVCCSPPPETFKSLKYIREQSKSQNKLSAIEFNAEGVTNKTETSTKSSSTKRRIQKKNGGINKKFDMNDFFDLTAPFDLFRRKRQVTDNGVRTK